MRTAAFAALLAIYGLCVAEYARADERVQYKRETKEFTVRLHFDTQSKVLHECNAMHAWREPIERAPASVAIGCARFDEGTKVCDVYTPAPVFDNDSAMTNLGHEVLHCYAGKFHTEE